MSNKDITPARARSNANLKPVKKGEKGRNPKGRPPGKSFRQLLREVSEADNKKIIKKMVDMAMKGDVRAAQWTAKYGGFASPFRYKALADNLPAIIFGVVYYDLGEHGVTWKRCVEKWEAYWKPALQEEHHGDCTNECHSCTRCQAEDVMKLVDIVRKGLNDGE